MKDEDVKIYHFAREYRDSLVPTEEEKRQAMKANFLEKFRILKSRMETEKETKVEKQDKETITIEMAEELIQKCEKAYGENLERLDKVSDGQLASFYNITRNLINELGKSKQQEENSLETVKE